MFQDFFFNQFSISSFSQFLLSFLITLFFLVVKKQHPRGWFRTLFFVAITLVFLSTFLSTSLYVWWSKYFIATQYIFLMVAVSLITQYVYRYPVNYFTNESRLLLGISLFITGAVSSYLVYSILQNQFFAPYELQVVNLLIVSGFFWAAGVATRYSLLPILKEEFAQGKTPAAGSPDWVKLFLSAIRAVLAGRKDDLYKPFREHFVLVFILFTGALPSVLNFLFHTSLISLSTNLYLSNVFYLLFLFLFILAYFKLSPEHTTINRKIITVSLLTILVVLSTVGTATMSTFARQYMNTRSLPDFTTLHFEPGLNGSYQVSSEPAVWQDPKGRFLPTGDAGSVWSVLPFPFPFYGVEFRSVYVGSNGILSFGDGIKSFHYTEFFRANPKIAALFKDLNPSAGGAVLLKEEPGKVTVSWVQVPDFGSDQKNTFQIVLYPSGKIDLTYYGISDLYPGFIGLDDGTRSNPAETVRFTEDLPASFPKGTSVFEDFYRNQREYIHKGASVFILMILLSAALALIVFPSFFRLTVTQPLKTLLDGVRRVNEGDLTVQVKVKDDDEIGYLTRSFNQMIDSVRLAKEEELLLIQKEKEEELLQMELSRKSEELEFARNLQMNMLPADNPDIPGLTFVGRMRPATEVGGDYYDLIHIADHRYCVAIGDATGHGVAAGLVVGMVKMALINSIRSYNVNLPLEKLMINLNIALRESIHNRGIGMGLCLMVIDLDKMKADLTSTGMPFPFFFRKKTGDYQILELTGPPLGMVADLELSVVSMDLEPGDLVVFVSDGFTERMNPEEVLWFENQKFNETVESVLKTVSDPEAITGSLFQACDEFAGGLENEDDMTSLIIRVDGLKTPPVSG